MTLPAYHKRHKCNYLVSAIRCSCVLLWWKYIIMYRVRNITTWRGLLHVRILQRRTVGMGCSNCHVLLIITHRILYSLHVFFSIYIFHIPSSLQLHTCWQTRVSKCAHSTGTNRNANDWVGASSDAFTPSSTVPTLLTKHVVDIGPPPFAISGSSEQGYGGPVTGAFSVITRSIRFRSRSTTSPSFLSQSILSSSLQTLSCFSQLASTSDQQPDSDNPFWSPLHLHNQFS